MDFPPHCLPRTANGSVPEFSSIESWALTYEHARREFEEEFAYVKQAVRDRRRTMYYVPRAWTQGENVFCSSEQHCRRHEWRYYLRKEYRVTRLRQLGVDTDDEGEPIDVDFTPSFYLAPPINAPKNERKTSGLEKTGGMSKARRSLPHGVVARVEFETILK